MVAVEIFARSLKDCCQILDAVLNKLIQCFWCTEIRVLIVASCNWKGDVCPLQTLSTTEDASLLLARAKLVDAHVRILISIVLREFLLRFWLVLSKVAQVNVERWVLVNWARLVVRTWAFSIFYTSDAILLRTHLAVLFELPILLSAC